MNVRFPLRHAVLTASLLCCASTLHADDASKRAKANEVISTMHIEQNLNQIVGQQQAQIQKALAAMEAQGKMTADQQKDTNAFLQKANGIIRDGLNWPKLKPQFVDIYATTYTEQELDSILAFYRSPAGQKMLQSQPAIAAKSQAVLQGQMADTQPKLRDAFDEFKKEMQVKYPNLK